MEGTVVEDEDDIVDHTDFVTCKKSQHTNFFSRFPPIIFSIQE